MSDPESICLLSLSQLPVYVPNKEEMQDPAKYAKNVRKVMVCPNLLIYAYLWCLLWMPCRLAT